MNLQSIINQYEAGQLTLQPTSVLESARLEVEAAQDQARHQPTLAPLRDTLLNIESSITRTLVVRYGCDD